MTVEMLIEELNKIKDKTKDVYVVICAGKDVDSMPFIEQSRPLFVSEEVDRIELIDAGAWKYGEEIAR